MIKRTLLAVLIVFAAQGLLHAEKIFRAGAAAVDISPPELPVIINGSFTEFTADTIVDRLHVRCLVLDDGTTQMAIAVVDSCMVPRSLLDEAKAMAEKATGIPTSRMLVSATHTHSAPSVHGVLGSDCDVRYSRFLPAKIAEAIALAQKNLTPAQIGWAVGKDEKNVYCRRYRMKPGTAMTNPFSGTEDDRAQMGPGSEQDTLGRTGPVDTDVSVVAVRSRDGKPLAVLGNYSTHYAGSPAVSADYFGVFCRRIEQLVGAENQTPSFVGLMTNGTSGDANCSDGGHGSRRQYDYFTVGEDVAQAAYAAYQSIHYRDWAPIVMEEATLTLAVRLPNKDQLAAAHSMLGTFAGRKPRTIPEVYAREAVLLSQMSPTRELKLQAIRIGGLGITAIPNEVFGITGLTIKEQSPLKPTINISLANGAEGYIPPSEQHELGGYETWRARSSCLEVQAESKIKRAVLTLLEHVAEQRSEE